MTQVIKKEDNHPVSTEALISSENAHRPHTNIYHTPEAYIFEIELPGIDNVNSNLELDKKGNIFLTLLPAAYRSLLFFKC